MRRCFTLYSMLLSAIFIVGAILFSRPVIKALVKGSMQITMSRHIRGIEQTSNIEQVVNDLRLLSRSRSLRLALVDAEGQLIHADNGSAIPKLQKSTNYCGSTEDKFYAAHRFSVADQTYIVANTIDKEIIDNLIQILRISFAIFGSIAVIGFASLQVIGVRFFNRKHQKLTTLLQKRANFEEKEWGEKIESLSSSPIQETLLEFHEQVQQLKANLAVANQENNGILESLNEGVIVIDGRGRIRNINLKASQLLKLICIEFTNKSLVDLVKKNSTPVGILCLDLITSANEQRQMIKESIEVEKQYFELIVTPLKNKQGSIIIIQDHSSDYKVLSMGKNFVANASHELRTPITIIKGFTETLRELPDFSKEMLDDITEKILRNCHRMASVVKSLLVLADLDYSQKASMQPCDLFGLIESCSYTLLSVYPDAKIETLFNEKEATIWADPDLLELGVMNLLENAVKYSKTAAFITVTVESQESQVILTIRDRGVGISEKDLDHIFDRFYTVNKSHSRKLGGAGLGLSIVKAIMDKHNASIRAQAPEGEGIAFIIEFPKK